MFSSLSAPFDFQDLDSGQKFFETRAQLKRTSQHNHTNREKGKTWFKGKERKKKKNNKNYLGPSQVFHFFLSDSTLWVSSEAESHTKAKMWCHLEKYKLFSDRKHSGRIFQSDSINKFTLWSYKLTTKSLPNPWHRMKLLLLLIYGNRINVEASWENSPTTSFAIHIMKSPRQCEHNSLRNSWGRRISECERKFWWDYVSRKEGKKI